MAITPGGRVGDATPLGKPGGKRRLSDYTREIAHALVRAGHPKGEAIAIARNAEKRFAVKSKNPAIRSAALKATAEDKTLSHQKRDLAWDTFDANRPPGQQQPAAQPDLLTPEAHANIAKFQAAHGLPATGQIDPATTAWLNNPANSAAARTAAAGAAKKGASTAASAAKKATAAKVKAAKAAQTAQTKAAAETAKIQKANAAGLAKNAASQKSAAIAAGKSAQSRTASMSVPIVGVNDGGRIVGKPAFGGKKAAPFKKGGGRAKVSNVAKVQKMRGAKKKVDMANEVVAERDLDLDWQSFDAARSGMRSPLKKSKSPPKKKALPPGIRGSLTPAGLKGKSAKVGKTRISQKELFANVKQVHALRARKSA